MNTATSPTSAAGPRRTARRPRSRALLILVTIVCVVSILLASPPQVHGFAGLVSLALFAATGLTTAAYGVAITAVTPPLQPISEISILGKRASAFMKFALALGALFGTAFVGWAVAISYESVNDNPNKFGESTGQILQLLAFPLAIAAFIFWMLLSFDLLRLRRHGRSDAIDRISRMIRGDLMADDARAAFRWVGVKLLGDWWWVVGSFYMAPVVVVVLILFLAESATS